MDTLKVDLDRARDVIERFIRQRLVYVESALLENGVELDVVDAVAHRSRVRLAADVIALIGELHYQAEADEVSM